MRKAALAVAALLLPGCGSVSTDGREAAAQETGATEVYFLTGDRAAVVAVPRMIPAGAIRPRKILEALLAGPTDDEAERGISSALPRDADILDFHVENGTALVDLARFPAGANGPERVRITTQLTRSLVGVNGVQRVRLRGEAKPWGLWRMSDGGMLDVAYDEGDFRGFERVCAAVAGTESVAGDCFSATD